MFDLSKPELFESLIQQWAPQAIINTAAYTAVDKAEGEEDLALVVNGTAVGTLAEAARADQLPTLQELLGPVVTQRALMTAHETHVTKA